MGTIEAGKTATVEYEAVVQEGVAPIVGTVNITESQIGTQTVNLPNIDVKQTPVRIEASTSTSIPSYVGDEFSYNINIVNTSGAALQNVTVRVPVPAGTTLNPKLSKEALQEEAKKEGITIPGDVEGRYFYKINNEAVFAGNSYNAAKNEVIIQIPAVGEDDRVVATVNLVVVNQQTQNAEETIIGNAIVKVADVELISNDMENIVYYPKITVVNETSSIAEEHIIEGQEFEYILTVKNEGKVPVSYEIESRIPSRCKINKIYLSSSRSKRNGNYGKRK